MWVTLQCLSRSELLTEQITWILYYSECKFTLQISVKHLWLTFLHWQTNALAVFLNAHFNSNDSGPSSTASHSSSQISSLPIFAGLSNASPLGWLFIYLIHILIPTALLICMENTFWNTSSTGVDFVDLFHASFTFYVESGIRKKMEAEIDKLTTEQGGLRCLGPEDFQAEFYKIIKDHYLRKIHCFYLHLDSTHLTSKSSPNSR